MEDVRQERRAAGLPHQRGHTWHQDSRQRPEGRRRAYVPVVTLTMFVITALVTGAQFVFPQVLSTLRRNPQALAAGEWWRILSPLLVDPDGWLAIAAVAIGILLIGTVCERVFGHVRWLALYLGGALAGEIAGYAWLPYDAGSSIAVCGLIGGLLAYVFWRQDFASFVRTQGALGFIALLYAVGLIGALVGVAIGTATVSVVLGALLASALIWLAQLKVPARVVASYVGIAGLLGAIVLTALRDLHGPALLAGACASALMLWLSPALRHAGTPVRTE